MARTPGGLSLPGFLRIASRRWERHLTVHRGGARAQGLSELHLTGKAPGGFKMQIMQVADFDLKRWCEATLNHLEIKRAAWAATQEEQMADAERIAAGVDRSETSTP